MGVHGGCKRSWSIYTRKIHPLWPTWESTVSPHQLEAGKNTDWKGPPVFRWKVLTAHREHRQLCLKLSDKWWGGHQKGGVTIWVLMEGASGQRTPSHDYVLQKPEVTLWSRHMGEQEKTHKPTHMVQVQGGSSEIKTRAHLECGVMRVIQTLTDAKMSASFWWHDLYDHTHTHKWGQSAAHLESASHRAPG